jgi:hypothetical protein
MSKILLAAGTTTIGTEAAVEYLCHQETLRVLLDKLGTQNPDLNFEAILSVKVARGVPVKTALVAFRKYPSEGNQHRTAGAWNGAHGAPITACSAQLTT